MNKTLRLRLLGAPEICLDDQPLATPLAAKAQALLYYLAITGRAHTRVALAGLLWGDLPEETARTNLRKALADLRPLAGDYVAIDNQMVAVCARCTIWVDALEMAAKLNQRAAQVDAQRWQSALDLYSGDFLEGFYVRNAPDFETWVLTERTRYRQLVLQALHELAFHQARQGELGEAIAVVRRLLALEPWDEAAHGALMQWLAQSGQRSTALAQYELCRRSLADELAVEPGAETTALYEQIRTGKFDKVARWQGDKGQTAQLSPPHLVTLSPPHNLPASPAPLIGREGELGKLETLLRDPACRLLTIVGPGGVGKTRLAVEAARAILDFRFRILDSASAATPNNPQSKIQNPKFDDGVFFVPLASVSAPAYIIPAIAGALGFTFSGQLDAQTQLFNYLRQKQLLLVLDNLEHLLALPAEGNAVPPAAGQSIELLVDLLQAAPDVKILATAREPLNLPDEWVFDLKGLCIPPLASPACAMPEECPAQTAAAESCSAMTLFLRTARRVKVDFALTTKEQAAVVRICHLVDGLPLGIELAASWVRALSCQEIADEIQCSLAFLTTTQRGIPARHRSMLAVFDHSWQLLAEEEQRVLQGLSVFRGGFTRQAAAAVTGATLPVLSALVAKSLVRRSGEQRYDLHELVRQFAAAKLTVQSSEQTASVARHARYFVQLLVQEEPILHGPDQQVALRRLTVELANLQQAWAWAAAQGWAQELRSAARSLWYFFELHNHFQEGEATFGHAQERLQALRTAGLPADTAVEIAWANLLTYQAMFAFRQGRTAYAKPLLRDAVHCLRPYDDAAALDDALWVYGAVCMFLGEFDEALGALDEARTLRGALQRPWSLVLNHMIQGAIRYEQGNYEVSYRLLSEAWKLARPLGDPRHLPFVSRFLSRTAQALGRHTEMVELLQEGLRLAQKSGDRFARALALEQLAQGNHVLGQVAETERYLAEALTLYQEIGDRWSHSRLLNFAGTLGLERGDEATAQQIFAQALQVALEGSTPPNALDALVRLATLRTNAGETLSAYTLAAAICHHPASIHQARDRAVQLQQELAPHLTAEQVEAAQAEARAAVANGTWASL